MDKKTLHTLSKDSLDIIAKAIEEIDGVELEHFLNKVLDVRKRKKRIYIAALGRSFLVMKAFAMRLMQLDFEVYVVGEIITPAIKAGDLLIVGSGSGNTRSLAVFAKEAIERQAEVLLITRNEDSLLKKLANGGCLRIPCGLARNQKQSNGSLFEESLLVLLDQCAVMFAQHMNYFERYADYNAIVAHRHANLQ